MEIVHLTFKQLNTFRVSSYMRILSAVNSVSRMITRYATFRCSTLTMQSLERWT